MQGTGDSENADTPTSHKSIISRERAHRSPCAFSRMLLSLCRVGRRRAVPLAPLSEFLSEDKQKKNGGTAIFETLLNLVQRKLALCARPPRSGRESRRESTGERSGRARRKRSGRAWWCTPESEKRSGRAWWKTSDDFKLWRAYGGEEVNNERGVRSVFVSQV
jgi:hypothetical protein